MKKIRETTKIIEPENQLKLYGYKNYFDSFAKLFEYGNLPNSILLSGPKGLGKATFIYHFVNYILSKSEKYKYDKDNFTINSNNHTYKLIKSQTHTNLFTLDSFNDNKALACPYSIIVFFKLFFIRGGKFSNLNLLEISVLLFDTY